jgi:electron transport complex protein RnfD
MEKPTLIVSSTPHIRSGDSIERIMGDVVIALLPAVAAGAWFFGLRAVMLTLVSVATAVLCEFIWCKARKEPHTYRDLSAVVTGLLLAMNLPSTCPWWVPAVGSAFAIVVVKKVFGGLGCNFINPALAGRALLMASYPAYMMGSSPFAATRFGVVGIGGVDAVSAATPLTQLHEGLVQVSSLTQADYVNALLGNIAGCLGETSAIALLLGGIYLVHRGVISLRIPLAYLITLFVLSFFFGRAPLYEILAGGVMLGAFFMATDYTTSPMTAKGQIIMGVGCGILTALIRVYGGYPEGCSYSILIMNLFVPLIDRFTKPRVFGKGKQKEAAKNA